MTQHQIPYRWRGVNRWWARVRGYFWLGCPLCGRHFGGHESGDGRMISAYDGEVTRALCRECPAGFFTEKGELLSVSEFLEHRAQRRLERLGYRTRGLDAG
jgi:hypothetical protein